MLHTSPAAITRCVAPSCPTTRSGFPEGSSPSPVIQKNGANESRRVITSNVGGSLRSIAGGWRLATSLCATQPRWGAAVDLNHVPPRDQHGALPVELASIQVILGPLVAGFALDLDPKGVQRVELVQRRLGAHPIGILRSLDRLEQELDLLRRELQGPEDDLLHLLVPIDCLPDHVVGV